MLVKGYKLSVLRRLSSGDLMYRMANIVNNTVYLTSAKKVDIKCSHHKDTNVNCVR